MEYVPNWFRWLIIVIATLIMCACRTPIQQQANQPMSVLVRNSQGANHQNPQSQEIPRSGLPSGYDLSKVMTADRIMPKPQPEFGEGLDCKAPIVRHNGRRLYTENLLQAAAGADSSKRKAPVYFHVEDPLFEPAQAMVPVEATPIADPGAGNLGSPFVDDPIDIVSPQMPSAEPVVATPVNEMTTDGFQQPAPPTVLGMPQPEPIYSELAVPTPEVIIAPGAAFEPIVNHVDSIPLAPTTMESYTPLPSPFDYLPQAEIPCEVAPEKWAMPPCETMGVSYSDLSRRYPDEYVCDGGDALGEVKVLPDWSLRHLDPEDTVGHYDTVDNEVEVSASNRVCIYAPRFAAVRKVTSPFQNDKYDQALIEQREELAVAEQQEIRTVSFDKSIAVKQDLRIQPAAGLQRNLPGVTGVHTLPVRVLTRDFSAHEDFRVMKIGIHKQSDKPRLAEYTTKAVSWSADMAVQVVVDGVLARANISHQKLSSFHTIGDNRPAKLRVIKTASVADALPGEEVEFTLRFDNVGHQEMGNVTIIDNLTTRLEYLQDTELCSLKNNFVVEENEVDSLTLRWEITDPIKPGKGGLIRFKCRVR